MMFNTHLGRYRFLCVPFRLKMSQGHLPNEDGWHCGPMPWSVGHTWWHVHLWKEWQRPWCKHRQPVQCGPKEGLVFNSKKVCHKARVCDVLWAECSLQKDTPQIWKRSKASLRWHQPDEARTAIIPRSSELSPNVCAPSQLKHWAPTGPPKKGELLCMGREHQHLLPENKVPTAESPQTPEILWLDQTGHPPVWCLTQGARSLHHTRWTAHDICQQIPHGHQDPICQHQERTFGHHIWLWKIPYIPLWQDIRTFIAETDHKPLKMISLKNLTVVPAWLQRMLLCLQQYDLVIMYQPGREMLLADALSCLPSRTNTEIKCDLWVDTISMFAFSQRCLTKIAAETQWDPILLMVHQLTLNGWPNRQGHVPKVARFYWSFWDELSIDGDLLTKGERVVIPPSCRDNIRQTSMEAMPASTRQWTWPEHVFTGPAWKQTSLTTSSGAWHALRTATYQWRCCNPMRLPPRPWVKIGVDFFQDHLGKKAPNSGRLLQQVPICISSGIYTSFQDHQPPKGTLCSWRCAHHHHVWQQTSLQWRGV